ncbi:MAG TPA: methionyl-tRNA formyltransferase [Patescibacteria group bacterium]|nr:methionyl-tRNA formyltransferase [Patescibacteria group bacterium]
MKIVFFGNTKYSLIGAKIIHEQLGLSHIITIPDRPDKRGRMQESPLKTFGKENAIPVLEVNKITDETIEQINQLQPDFFVVEDYGLILPKKLLTIPKIAALNIHHSLLPKYRGSSPAPTALLNGDRITGVSVILMTETLDAGDILGQKEYEVTSEDTTDSLLTVLNQLGGELIVPILTNFNEAQTKSIKQNESKVTFTKMMKKEDGFIDASNPPPAERLDRMIRAYYPWPTVWTTIRIKNHEARIKLLPKKIIQMEGKQPITIKDFLNGYLELEEKTKKFLQSLDS